MGGRDSPPAPRDATQQPVVDPSKPILDVLSTLTKGFDQLSSAISKLSPTTDALDQTQGANGLENHVTRSHVLDGRAQKRRRTEDVSDPAWKNTPAFDVEPELGENTPDLFRGQRLKSVLHEFFVRVQPWLPILHLTKFPQLAEDPMQRKKILIVLHAINVAALRFVTDEDGAPLSPDYVASEVKRSRNFVILT